MERREVINERIFTPDRLFGELAERGRKRYERMEAGELHDINLDYYNKRYDTVVGGERGESVFDASTFVKGKRSACYFSELTESGVFTGYIAYRSRPEGEQDFRSYPFGCGTYDSEVDIEGTQPLSMAAIQFIQAKKILQKVGREIDICELRSDSVNNLGTTWVIRHFLGNDRVKAFEEGTDGYYAIIGTDVGMGKARLARYLDKQIVRVKVASSWWSMF